MFEIEYLWNSWVEKDGVNVNLVLWIGLTLDILIEFAFSLCLSNIFNATRVYLLRLC